MTVINFFQFPIFLFVFKTRIKRDLQELFVGQAIEFV